ncbi:hypothetical protein SAMN05216266_11388 [Amycolatopsis marina]|uniref:Secreted protein n=1 Tax=Amycolatopsis marina TaxID=490629 RepID=A0A1I1BCF7_9PSEU|nr:hypothetical protein [Amycolatopsis marina]SFB48055.1 hypothetical protein SAMN05216266_11388 [Amycolatopsis marina]
MTRTRATRRLSTAMAGLACSASLGLALAPTASAQETSADAVEWSTSHGTAEASGTRWVEGSSIFDRELVVQGELRNSGDGCYSVWVRWIFDLAPGPERKNATVCGAGSVPVDIRGRYTTPTTTAYLRICRGETDVSDCGPTENLTSWPIEG